MRRFFIVNILLILFISSCKRDRSPLEWDADYLAPICYGELGIEHLLPDTLLENQLDSSVMLKYEGNLVGLDLGDIVAIPDTTIRDTFSIPLPSVVQFTPGQVFINDPQEEQLQLTGIELKTAKIKSGQLNYELKSSIVGQVIYTYQIPSAKDWQGNIFSKTITVPATTTGNLAVVSGSFDLSGYYLDLTGMSGNGFNKILTNINCKVDPNNSSSVGISGADYIYISNQLAGVIIEEAEGYFGTHQISTGIQYEAFESFSKFISGGVDLASLEIDVLLSNGIGVDAFITINDLISARGNTSVSLQHSVVGELITMARPIKSGTQIIPSEYQFQLNDQNSNVVSFVELLPTQVGYDLDLVINPMGNISGFNDFYYSEAPIGLFLNAEMPLSLAANDLTLQDTLLVDLGADALLNELTLLVEVENGFPLEAQIELAVLDMNNHIAERVLSPNLIPAASLNGSGRVIESVNSNHEIYLSPKNLERLRSNGKLLLTVIFNTPSGQKVTIYQDNRLKFVVKADANIKISLGNE